MPPTTTVRPKVLVLASRYDLSCDYVVSALRRSGHPYFRLNSEDLPTYTLCLDPCRRRLSCHTEDVRVEVEADRLVGVYFRRPTFLREASQAGRRPEEQFARAQWAAFLRNLMVFDMARWVNHPTRTYEAEHKMIQLLAAFEVGFDMPATYCLNSEDFLDDRVNGSVVAIKGLDTVLVRTETTESFGYTNLLLRKKLEEAELSGAPLVAQQALTDKLDLRVTVGRGSLVVCFGNRKRIRDRRRLAAEEIECSLLGVHTSPGSRSPLYRVDPPTWTELRGNRPRTLGRPLLFSGGEPDGRVGVAPRGSSVSDRCRTGRATRTDALGMT